jgi:hypothetical protein
MGGGSRFAAATVSSVSTPTADSTTPRDTLRQGSQMRTTAAPVSPSPAKVLGHGTAMSQLQPAQVRTLKEAFQVLDRDSDGMVGRDDVADMLNQLGTGHSGPK